MTIHRIILSLLLIFCQTSFASDFIVKSLPEAQQIATQTKQPILLILGSPTCVFCEKLKNDLSEPELQQHTDRYIICYVDLLNQPDYKDSYKVTSIPDSRIIKNNKQISRAQGYKKVDYINWLKNQ
jgi:thioredoxin-related protein